MPSVFSFTPGPTGTFTAGALAANRLAFGGGGTSLRVTNAGTVPVYVKSGDVTVTATTNDWLVAPSTTVFFTIPGADTYVAASTGQATTATTYVQRGDGGV